MAKPYHRPDKQKKNKKTATKGSGGQRRRGLRGKGATPKAEDRVYHAAHKRKLERKLVNAYREEILSRARNLHAPEQVVELASLAAAADGVRGFEDKKIDSAQELLQKLGRAGVKK